MTDQIADLLIENEQLKAQLRKLKEANDELFYRFCELSKELRIYEVNDRKKRIENI